MRERDDDVDDDGDDDDSPSTFIIQHPICDDVLQLLPNIDDVCHR